MNTFDLQAMLGDHDWRALFDAPTLARAAVYFRRGSVISLQHREQDDGDVLRGVVAGSRAKPYIGVVRIRTDGEALEAMTDCSCPVGVRCKHIAALLLMATSTPPTRWPGSSASAAMRAPRPTDAMPIEHAEADAGGADPLHAWARWLSQLGPTQAKTASGFAAAERQFGVLLASPLGPSAALRVSPVWLRPSVRKSGGAEGVLVDPQPLQLDQHGPIPEPADGWPAGVASALTVLLQAHSTRDRGQRWWHIVAEFHEAALQTLLQHYPLFLDRGSQPLHYAAALPMRLQWVDLANGNQRLDADVAADEPAQLLRGARIWYLLPQCRQLGLVDVDPALLAALRSVPEVRPEQASALRQLLARKGVALPLPAERSAPELVVVSPTPVLELRTLAAVPGRGPVGVALGYARLLFDYAGVRVDAATGAPRVRRLQQTRVLEIQRHASAEQQTGVRLRQLGFVQAGWRGAVASAEPTRLLATDWLLQPSARHESLPAREWSASIERLTAAGFRIEYLGDFPRQQLLVIDDWHAELIPAGHAWFEVALGVDVAGERIDLLPVLRQLIADPRFPRQRGKRERQDATWRLKLDASKSVDLPLARLRELIEPLLEWLEREPTASPRVHISQAEALDAMALPWRGGERLRAQLEAMRTRQRPHKAPVGFKATLRPYQLDGLAWLDFLADAGLGGVLADDMGLGKTVQVLAHLVSEKRRGRLSDPVLAIVPTSLVGNWQLEAERFAPSLRVLVLHGADRAQRYHALTSHDLIITSYPLLARDRDKLLEQRYSLLVLDEAQAIKNAASQAARVVRELSAVRRLAMTGTPLENHLGELWAQVDAVEPGLLGSQRQFARSYRTPIEKHGDADRQQRLNRRLRPLLLRRRKQDVLAELPPKTEIVHTLELQGDQRALYETLRLAQHQRVRQAVAERGLRQSGIVVLDALLKLRQACCDPRLVKLQSASKAKHSAKLEALLELLDGLLDDGRRVLLFSQFTEMLTLIEAALVKRKIAYQILTGQTPARQRTDLVKRFQQGKVPLFLISLKAGGVGLNLTAADTVIHYDPWWNPAVEAQATDRAHRIGQDKPVFVYRLICKGTVEEKIHAMQAHKAELARAVLDGGGASTKLRFNEKDLDALFGEM